MPTYGVTDVGFIIKLQADILAELRSDILAGPFGATFDLSSRLIGTTRRVRDAARALIVIIQKP